MATIMTKRGTQDNVLTYEHICDTTADMASIDPQYITLGSTCLVTQGESGGTEAYIANSNKEWIEIVGGSGSDSGEGDGASEGESSSSHTIKPNARLVLIDYDGAIVDSYTQSEVDALSALPGNPDHSGDEIPLTSQGWNWTLEEIKEQLTAMPEQVVYVGNVIVPTDGKTHIVIEIPEDTPENRRDVTVRWNQTASEGVTVDWGDGSATETYSETGANDHDHTYASGGMYDITLDVTSGTISFGGGRDQGIAGAAISAYQYKIARFRKVFIGSGTTATSFGDFIFSMCGMLEIVTVPNDIETIGNSAFYACYSLKSITIPRTVTTINSGAFSTCYHMTSISIPAGITSLESYVFQNCESIEEITIPKAVTSLGSYVFSTCKSLKKVILPPGTSVIASQVFSECTLLRKVIVPSSVTAIGDRVYLYCYNLETAEIPEGVTTIDTSTYGDCRSLTKVTIPSSVTRIREYAFSGCAGVSEYHIKRTTPPSLGNTNAFIDIASDCVFYVPYSEDHSVLNAYKSASYWSTYANRMQEEPQ